MVEEKLEPTLPLDSEYSTTHTKKSDGTQNRNKSELNRDEIVENEIMYV